MSRVERNKKKKKEDLLSSAYELFNEKGISKTTIEDITSKAGVAKGTFYLYFKNKKEIEQYLIVDHSYKIVMNAVELSRQECCQPIDRFIKFLDYIIDYFKENPDTLKVIHKNLSWGIFTNIWLNDENKERIEEIDNLLEEFSSTIYSKEIDEDKKPMLLFIIMEMFGSVLYSSIIEEEPVSIDQVKPVMFEGIRKILS